VTFLGSDHSSGTRYASFLHRWLVHQPTVQSIMVICQQCHIARMARLWYCIYGGTAEAVSVSDIQCKYASCLHPIVPIGPTLLAFVWTQAGERETYLVMRPPNWKQVA